MHHQPPAILAQRQGQPLCDVVVQATALAITRDQHVPIRLASQRSEAEVRVTAQNTVQVHPRRDIANVSEAIEHDRLRVKDACAMAQELRRPIEVFCRRVLDEHIVVTPDMTEDNAILVYDETNQKG